jgi:hypothetical protein
MSEPTKEGAFLARLLGEWVLTGQDDEGKPYEGRETVRTLTGVWYLVEASVETSDGPMCTVITLGYEPDHQRVAGTFITDRMPLLWNYIGELDSEHDALHLHAEGPDFFHGGTTASYRDTIQFDGPDERRFVSQVLLPSGERNPFMNVRYRRD